MSEKFKLRELTVGRNSVVGFATEKDFDIFKEGLLERIGLFMEGSANALKRVAELEKKVEQLETAIKNNFT